MIRRDIERDGVRYVESEPGDGSRYSCFVSVLPEDAEGGSRDTHRLVTLCSPVSGAYVFEAASGHYLAPYYVAEKLGVPPRFLDGVLDLVRYALDRETEFDEDGIRGVPA